MTVAALQTKAICLSAESNFWSRSPQSRMFSSTGSSDWPSSVSSYSTFGGTSGNTQVVKTWRTGSAKDFSLITLLMIEAGTSLWIFYGLLRDAPAIWLGNGVTFALVGLILSVKIKDLLVYNKGSEI
jgi:MtN3 and saliva related transmembrane protein